MSLNHLVTAQKQTFTLKIKPWGCDSPFPNLLRNDFRGTYPYNYRDTFNPNIEERQFEALLLENDFVRATIIPDLGARIFSLYDKVAECEVFNRPDVICPSPIFLRGAYLPIGLEMNFPCGHSVHAVEPIPCEFVEEGVGKGVRMHVFNAVNRMYTEIIIHLQPGERLLHSRITFRNTLPVRNGFMYWSNPAVSQSPEMTFQCKAPMSHFFVDYNTFPFVDGLDLRVAKNRHFASDAFAIGSPEDWFGFYCPERGCGAVHISPVSEMKGKKFFSWGFDEYAFRWGRHYGCDQYGYMEFQAGILETQFEYLHLEPFSERIVNETWFPYNNTGNISHADANFIFSHHPDTLDVTSSRAFDNLTFFVTVNGEAAQTEIPYVKPGQNVPLNIPVGYNPDNYKIRVQNAQGHLLIDDYVTTPAVATAEQILEKQDWLEMEPVDPASTLEVAQRKYNSRAFDQAQMLAEQLVDTYLAKDACRLLTEINYVRDNGTEEQSWSEKLGHSYTASLKNISIDAIDTDGASDAFLSRFDYFAAIAHADALVCSGEISDAMSFITNWRDKSGHESACLEYVVAYLQYILLQDEKVIQRTLAKAGSLALEQANPFTSLEKKSLCYALECNLQDAGAYCLLGNYWATRDEAKAVSVYQKAIELNPMDYIALRNLAYFTMRQRQDLQHAMELYEQACNAKCDCPNLIVEYIIALRLNNKLAEAFSFLQSLPEAVAQDYRIIKIKAEILRDNHRFAEAIELLTNADNLYVWEGETSHHRCFVECCEALGKQALEDGDYSAAEKRFSSILSPPESLIRNRPKVENLSIVYYHLALVAEAQNDRAKTEQLLNAAVDQPLPELHHWVSYREHEYYTALAAGRLGRQAVFDEVVQRLIATYPGDDYVAANIDISVADSSYARYLGPARGFMLVGQFDRAARSIAYGEKYHGYCFALEQACKELHAIESKCLVK